jgi:hypothetical protein
MQQEKQIPARGTRPAIHVRMFKTQVNVESTSHPNDLRSGPTFVSLVAAKAGREAVWVLIACAFVVVEAAIFVTQLPAARLFARREVSKAAGSFRR